MNGSSAVRNFDRAVNAPSRPAWKSETALLIYVALATVIAHLVMGNRYGFHRDELATLDDARNLAWGYVAYPPVTPFFGRLSLILFGTSLAGFRLFANLAQATTIVLAGLMARELGGRRTAQLLAAVASVGFCIAGGQHMMYVAFDTLAWVLTAYFVIRLLKSEDPRWWLAIGAAVGFGMLSKYSMAFFATGLALAVLFTPARRYFRSKWLWLGVGLAFLIFLPNLIWQVQNHFVSLDMLRHIHERDIRIGRTKYFLPEQLLMTDLGLPLALAGLWFYFRRGAGTLRAVGWMYVVPLVLFTIGKGRGYYLAAAYPMLYAGGSVWLQQKLERARPRTRTTVTAIAWTALILDAVVVVLLFLPLFTPGSKPFRIATKMNGDFVEEIGWPELVREVARVRDSLPAEDRTRVGVLAANYGEAGAISLYGPQYGLPAPISGINSFWQRGYGNPPPEVLIVLGFSQRFRDANFASCAVAGHITNPYGVKNEEAERPDIYVCRGLRQSWPEFWKDFRYYG